MNNYIDREAFITEQRQLYCDNCAKRKNGKGRKVYAIGDAPCRSCGIGDVLEDIEDAPAADVRPVVRGKWTLNKDGSGTCSECGRTQKNCWDLDNCDNFCHFCGADMREES